MEKYQYFLFLKKKKKHVSISRNVSPYFAKLKYHLSREGLTGCAEQQGCPNIHYLVMP